MKPLCFPVDFLFHTGMCLIAALIFEVSGHGRLIHPPGRSTMWRYGFNTRKNYNDNELFCGGFPVHWWQNGGKCGVCGDPYNVAVRQNEPPYGEYAQGIIAATYRRGETIKVKVEITASHKGYFEFRLCPNNNVKIPATQECLNRNLLQEAYGNGTKIYLVDKSVGLYEIHLMLPDDVICDQCVLQWRYRTGNRWGCHNNDFTKGPCGLGYGPQEEFYACSDIAILPRDGDLTTTEATPHSTVIDSVTSPTSSSRPSTPSRNKTGTTPTKTSETTTQNPTTKRPGQPIKIVCSSAGAWKGSSAIDLWCEIHCKRNYCPATHCECRPEGLLVDNLQGLLGTGRDCFSFSKSHDLDMWCRHNCPLGFCDPRVCYCAIIRN